MDKRLLLQLACFGLLVVWPSYKVQTTLLTEDQERQFD